MAKKKDTRTLDEMRRCVKQHLSYHNTKVVNIEQIAKELGVKKLDLWEFIQANELYFVTRVVKIRDSDIVKWRYIRGVLEQPMTETELQDMKKSLENIGYC